MIIDASCMIWFHFDCIMQLKKSCHIATNVVAEKVLLLLVISLTDIIQLELTQFFNLIGLGL